ncbi:MAG: hypothetical protein JWN12_571 [Candidatus Saccharibacteria bacterium]|nr:hypothetical protein [Candidatus Saccharibacteria bacterium]
MKKNKNNSIISSKNLLTLSAILFVVSLLAFVVVPIFFTTYFCGQDLKGCGFAGAGIGGYALYVASVPFFLAVLSLIAGLIRKSK